MIVWGLDPATHCGWSIGFGGNVPAKSGMELLSAEPSNECGGHLHRLWRLLIDLGTHGTPEAIGAEDAALGSPNAGTKAWHNEIKGVIRLFGQVRGIPVEFFTPSEIKKFATGKGDVGKDLMVQAYQRETGQKPVSDDVADAYFVMRLMEQRLRLPPELLPSAIERARKSQRAKFFRRSVKGKANKKGKA